MGRPACVLAFARASVATPAAASFGAQGCFRFLATFGNSSSSSASSSASSRSGSSSADAAQEAAVARRQRILFLGTPQVAALVLERLLAASRLPGSNFEVAAVVSRPSGRHWLERERERDTVAVEPQRPAAPALASGAASTSTSTPAAAPELQVSGSGGAACSSTSSGLETASAQVAAAGHGVDGPGREGQHASAGAAATDGTRYPGGAAVAAATAAAATAAAPNWSRHGASAVERVAAAAGLPPDRILCPVSAKEPGFLAALAALQPDLAITAAYGALLPQAFLDLPRCGTLNIHPSLLPKYRGAAPVQRALQDGVDVSGVSLVFTVLKCDAGPVLEQQQVPVPPDVQAPQLSEQLFELGVDMLLRHLPAVLQQGRAAAERAERQDEAAATYAHKILRHEGYLDFRQPAAQLHNTVRALAGWPGARATLLLEAKGADTREPIEIKILRTRVASPDQLRTFPRARRPPHATDQQPPQGQPTGAATAAVPAAADAPLPPGAAAQVVVTPAGELLVPCGDGSLLQILEVGRRSGGVGAATAPSKSLGAKEFVAGLARRRLYVPLRTGSIAGVARGSSISRSSGDSAPGQTR
ncbi:hypothetical protein HXX76_005930 [Chlamydomonas incerta]|uniref:methionyl-tRNA formyltransferase n=1 Tax=Chlamydomonas incerta TaxID=51695 RepID=A0A835TFF1_CHLIN|nr:hypothetical protein HXX76_005930 [Chlamydomonas incerta]|eukprot:KAG2437271.1 hypothetical protein HXX76_005930 [Chlamydomonas incerta]